jgi:hypothetical protein
MYNIKALTTRGSNHPLHCEDDLCIEQTSSLIVAAVFDGCSSGVDSHVASTFHRTLVRQSVCLLNTDSHPVEELSKDILQYLYDGLHQHARNTLFEVNKEMLSTVILLLVDKNSGDYHITVAGDGVVNINDAYFNIHDKEGDAVFYLSSIIDPDAKIAKYELLDEYIAQHCTTFAGRGFRNISISTDGIDTFKTKFGIALKDKSRDFFMKNQAFEKTQNQLKRLYNIYTQGLNLEEKVPCINFDDFTMIKVTNDLWQ